MFAGVLYNESQTGQSGRQVGREGVDRNYSGW